MMLTLALSRKAKIKATGSKAKSKLRRGLSEAGARRSKRHVVFAPRYLQVKAQPGNSAALLLRQIFALKLVTSRRALQ